jgi:hypothetical protein
LSDPSTPQTGQDLCVEHLGVWPFALPGSNRGLVGSVLGAADLSGAPAMCGVTLLCAEPR